MTTERWTSDSDAGYWEWPSSSAMVRTCWRVVVDADGTRTTGGAEYWALAFNRSPDGTVVAQVAGPTLRPRTMTVRAGEVSWGVDLQAHVFRRGLAKPEIVGVLRDLPTESVGGRWWFELGGVRVPVPGPDELDVAVDRLARAGVLRAEPAVADVLGGSEVDVAERTLRRRFQQATGLRRGQVEQVRRARHAYALLQQGLTLADAAAGAGFADQAHMTRQLRALAGSTPAQILDRDGFSTS